MRCLEETRSAQNLQFDSKESTIDIAERENGIEIDK